MRHAAHMIIGVAFAVLTVTTLFSQQRPPGSQTSGTGFIMGQVVDADGGKGVSGAIVTIGAPPTAPPSLGELVELGAPPAVTGRRVLTGSDGRFLFRELAKGRYAISVAAPGYAPANFGQGRPGGPGQTIDLDEAQRLGGITVRAWKFAAITGTVVDDRGEPAVGISVRCLRRTIAGGQPRFTASGSLSQTDDRGMYRSASLVPGEYVCGTSASQTTMPVSVIEATAAANASGNFAASEVSRAMQSSGGRGDDTGFRVGDFVVRTVGGRGFNLPRPTSDGRVLTYATQYFPAGSTPSQATVITVKSGEERGGVNLQLRLVPGVRVSGTVTGPNGPGAFLGVVLVPASFGEVVSENVAEAARTVSDASGRFAFLGLPAGQYVLKMRVNPRAGATGSAPTTTVEGAPVAAVELGLAAPAGAVLAGRGATPPPPPPTEPSLWATLPIGVGDADVPNVAVVLRTGFHVTGRVEFVGARTPPTADQIQRLSIRMQSAEGRTSSTLPAEGRAAADGTFRTGRYAGGKYIASVIAGTIPPGWSLRSITSNGKDISVEPVELADGDLGGVVMTFTDQTTELSGTVTNSRNVPDPNTGVVVFPADSDAWRTIGVVFRRWRDERVSRTGTFSISGLPPGEYFVAAVPSDGAADTRDPKYLASLTRAASRVTLGDGEKKTIDLKVTR